MKLTKEQIKNWRKVMAMNPNIGFAAMFLPDEVVVSFATKVKQIVENDPNAGRITPQPKKQKPIIKKCPPHNNIITGSRGAYCIDCENYV